MPRADYSASYYTHAGNAAIFPEVLHAVVLTDGVTTYRYATQAVTFRLAAYTSRLKRISSVTSALNQGLQKVTIVLQNADLAEASQLPINGYEGFDVTVYKIIRDDSFAGLDYLTLFTGVVTGFRGDEAYLEIDAVTSVNRAGNISNRRVGVKCPWVFKDSNCGYVGVETTCNKLYTDTGGCSGRSNQHKFGGFPSRPAADPKTLSGGGAPPAYQLVKDGSSTYKQQTYLEFTGGATITNNDGALKTTIDFSSVTPAGIVNTVLNVKDAIYGAVGDGVTDDTTAIQDAIDDAEAGTTSRTVYFPPGTYLVTGLTVAGNVTLMGLNNKTTIIKSTSNAVIIDCIAASFEMPVIERLRIQGSVSAGTSQTGLKMDDATYGLLAAVRDVYIYDCGGAGLYVGNVFSSLFENIFSSNCVGGNYVINSPSMPVLTFEHCDSGTIHDSYRTGYHIKAGNVIMRDCNSIYGGSNPEWCVTIGRRIGQYGEATANGLAFVRFEGCNFESSTLGGVQLFYNSRASFHNCTWVGGGVSGSYKPILYDVCQYNPTETTGNITSGTNSLTVANAVTWAIGQGIKVAGAGVASADLTTTVTNVSGVTLTLNTNASTTVTGAAVSHTDDIFYPATQSVLGVIDDDCGFSNTPASYYTDSEPVHITVYPSTAVGIPPLATNGRGPKISADKFVSSFRNDSTSKTWPLPRMDGFMPVQTITASTTYVGPGVRYIECNHSAPITITLPWPGWMLDTATEPIIIKDRSSAGAGTNNITINASGGGTVNGSSYTINADKGAVMLMPHSGDDYRVVASYAPSGETGIRVIDVTDYGAVGDDSTDNTTAIQSALTAANSAGEPLYFPPGTYQLDNLYIGNLNSIRIFGAGPGRSILKSRGASASIIDIDADAASGHSFTIEELGFYGYGSGANNDGIEVRDSSSNGVANITLRNLRFNNCGNNAIRMTSAAFTILLEGIDVSMPAGANHAIDINGSNDLTLVRCYVHAVATNKAAYRIHSGTPTLIGCNGIDSGTTADWGVFGNESGEDGVDNYVRATLIGCNIETFSNIGIRCKSGSTANFIGCSFIAPGTGTVKAIKFDYVDSNLAGIFDAASSIITQGASWSNGYAVHSSGLPFIQVGNRELTSYYDTNVGGATTIPGIIGNLITGTSDYALTLDGYTKLTKPLLLPEQSAPATPPANNGWLYTKDTSGTTGLYFKNDAGTETQIDVAPAPSLTSTYIAFGSGSNLVTGNSTLTWDDTSKILTVSKAGGNPYVFVTDTTNTIDVRLGTLAGAPDRGIVGTMTNDPIVIYQNGSEAWGVDASKHMRPYNGNGTQDIGTSSAKARTAYLSASIDIGNDSVTSGQVVLRNSTNANALTLQAGATGSAYTFKLPTTGGTNGYYLQTDGTGTTSWAAVSTGANTALSNLASVAINTALLPTADGTIDLGSNAKSFRDTYNDRDIYIGRRLQSSLGTAPTTSAGTGAGTSPTITVSGNDICGAILLTTGTTPATSAKIVDVTFSTNFNNPAGTSNSGYPVVILQPANAAAAALSGNKQVYVNDAASTPALFQLKSGSTALDGATDYIWYYHVIGMSNS